MRVYVETNFVLELALLRDEHQTCEVFLDLARQRKIDLVLPSFSIGEAYEAWSRRVKQRKDLWRRLDAELLELSRSKPYRDLPGKFETLTGWLNQSGEEEKLRVESALSDLLSVAEVAPLSLLTVRKAAELQVGLRLSIQDSIIYASILDHLEQETKGAHCFITKNARDFLIPEIKAGLASRNCRLFARFGDALGFLEN
jgi:predicted nucleic acid-binding protein